MSWLFPPLRSLPPEVEMIRGGGDLNPDTLLAAYRAGYFPMPVGRKIGWFSPDPRGVIEPTQLTVSRSLKKSVGRYKIRLDTAFGEVVRACGDPSRPHGWINRDIIEAYTRLYHRGLAHSVEAWDDQGLAGGLYGISIGGLFAGESMFHRRTDASKVALVELCRMMTEIPGSLIDTQWNTPHLATLGTTEMSRVDYAERLETVVDLPQPLRFRPDQAEEKPTHEADRGPSIT